ncbi:rCG20157 [Rattus norvegicus]|uniref:RCG20157 n=1 Tax=Rattus norvegicus TaxID=10116 RepID=A6JGX4_RAT|nr:rCG20157 [Rattus norvegicus]
MAVWGINAPSLSRCMCVNRSRKGGIQEKKQRMQEIGQGREEPLS